MDALGGQHLQAAAGPGLLGGFTTLSAASEQTRALLADALGVSSQAMSNHLACLRGCGLVEAVPEGRRSWYRLADAHVRMLLDLTREHVSHAGSATDSKKETA